MYCTCIMALKHTTDAHCYTLCSHRTMITATLQICMHAAHTTYVHHTHDACTSIHAHQLTSIHYMHKYPVDVSHRCQRRLILHARRQLQGSLRFLLSIQSSTDSSDRFGRGCLQHTRPTCIHTFKLHTTCLVFETLSAEFLAHY